MSAPGSPAPSGGEGGEGHPAGFAARHPVVTATLVACALIGAALGHAYLPESWPIARRILAGAIAGAGVGLFLTVTKMFA